MICAASCHSTIGRTIFEPLVIVADDGNYYPYLLQSIEPNADFTVWTLVVREGIKFHDGTDLNADAVAAHITRGQSSALLAAAVRADRDGGTSDGALTTGTVTMDSAVAGVPDLPQQPAGLRPVADLDRRRRSRSSASVTEPVGTGPVPVRVVRVGRARQADGGTRFDDY